ncbi:MAG TPA: radical SAM protein, partial [Plasticicumulans sp.]|nr:radical SAM protein [Plasticicumulans sp.]
MSLPATLPPLPALSKNRELLTELQSAGLHLLDGGLSGNSRRGGAGPSDHQALSLDGHTLIQRRRVAQFRWDPYAP